MDEVYEIMEMGFEDAFEALRRNLARVRSGRAKPNLLDSVRVSYYGQPTPLNQVAAIQVPEARLLTIKPWESNLLGDIERAIMAANLGLNPSNDGTLIRVSIPPLTEESRKKLVRQVHEFGEKAKVAVRAARRDANETLKKAEKASDITEDDLARALKQVQDLTNKATGKVDSIIKAKEDDLMEI